MNTGIDGHGTEKAVTGQVQILPTQLSETCRIGSLNVRGVRLNEFKGKVLAEKCELANNRESKSA
jgi:hypothetical protein